MISKIEKQSILLNIKTKEEKMKISNIIDKYNKSEIASKVVSTNFLDLNERNVATRILNRENIKYEVYLPNSYCEKCIILFIPEFIQNIEYQEYVSCIKIECANFFKLRHKDFMGR